MSFVYVKVYVVLRLILVAVTLSVESLSFIARVHLVLVSSVVCARS
jgi:hypothetical protein